MRGINCASSCLGDGDAGDGMYAPSDVTYGANTCVCRVSPDSFDLKTADISRHAGVKC